MKQHTPSAGWRKNVVNFRLRKGIMAEKRLISIADSLADTFTILCIEKASPYLDSIGIDVLLTLLDSSSRIVQIPVQVKSSFKYKNHFIRRYPNFVKEGGIIVVIRDGRSDRCIREEIKAKIASVLRRKLAHVASFTPQRTNSSLSSKGTKRNILPFQRAWALKKKRRKRLFRDKRTSHFLDIAAREANDEMMEANTLYQEKYYARQ